ncbi:MAG: hypothetical protein WCE44_08575 [Candidatus Velthaea sp.]|jgi:hypothetical protein
MFAQVVLALLVAVQQPASGFASFPSAVRHFVHSPQRVTHAVIVGNYGAVLWSDRYTGGEQIYQRRGDRWFCLGGGGGVAQAADLEVLYKIPAPEAQRLVTALGSAPGL